jgi:iron complex transport system substrate-binding protein
MRSSAAIGVASAAIGVFTAFCITASTAAPISLEDDLGRKVELAAPAKRIVTLAPFLTELVYTVGAGDRIVGVSAFSDYPREARGRPVVSSAAGFDVERIAALNPDLVLAWQDSARPQDIERLTRMGAAVFVARSRTLRDPPRNLAAIGMLTAVEVSRPVTAYVLKLQEVRRRYRDRPALRAFLEVWHQPLTTIAGRHFMNEALEICGARNVFEDLEGVAPHVSWEELYRRDPQVVVGASSAATRDEFRANWRSRDTLEAVRQGRLVWVQADRIQRLTARTPDGVAELCEAIDRVR